MTAGTNRRDDRSDNQTQSVNSVRKALAEGFAAVRAKETNSGILSMSLAEMIARDLREINESQSEIRPGKIDEIERLRQRVLQAVEQATELPSSVFEITEQSSVANTGQDGETPDLLE